jgi:hypothetical protein
MPNAVCRLTTLWHHTTEPMQAGDRDELMAITDRGRVDLKGLVLEPDEGMILRRSPG